jgi:hypothetical protein
MSLMLVRNKKLQSVKTRQKTHKLKMSHMRHRNLEIELIGIKVLLVVHVVEVDDSNILHRFYDALLVRGKNLLGNRVESMFFIKRKLIY